MKFPLLLLCLMACTTAMHAQNPRIETFGDRRTETYLYKIGYDSLRYTILGQDDTIQQTYFYKNGRPSSIAWKKDSFISFDILGRKSGQKYGRFNEDGERDSSVTYYPSGQVFDQIIYKENIYRHRLFRENGELISVNESEKTKSGRYVTTKNAKGVKITASRFDTLKKGDNSPILLHDTAFYANGRPFKIGLFEGYKDILGTSYFDESGKLVHQELADSTRLVLFKDNVDCYYGLKNTRGDTIVKPRFDLIEPQEELFFAAYTGESVILLDNKGAPMTPPVDQMSTVTRLNKNYEPALYEHASDNQFVASDYLKTIKQNVYFRFMSGKKYGVMTEKGALVMPPQYLPISPRYMGDGAYFEFHELIKDSMIRMGFLNRQGKSIFEPNILGAQLCSFEDYFLISKQLHFDNYLNRSINLPQKEKAGSLIFEFAKNNIIGLAKGDGTQLLPLTFSSILRVPRTSLFVTTLVKTNQSTQTGWFQEGIFDVHRRIWLVDTAHFSVDNKVEEGCTFFVIKNITTKKFGIMDTTGKYVVPLSYDSIGVASQEKGLFWVKKGGSYQILTINEGKTTLSKTKYAFLAPTSFNYFTRSVNNEKITYFIAQLKEKWGVIDAKEQVIKPFDYDYAALGKQNLEYFILVKNNSARYFDLNSLPNETDEWTKLFHTQQENKKVVNYPVLGNSDGIFFVNDTGKVVIPPQYKPLSDDFDGDVGNHVLVEDAQKKKKIIFLETSKIVDYPFNYDLKLTDAQSRVIGVSDTGQNSFGVVSTDGKVLVPCVNYGISIGSEQNSAFFVKRDTFPYPEDFFQNQGLINMTRKYDTLTLEDNDWLLYDSNGKVANTEPFRYPIYFKKGVGAGMQSTGFQLFKDDGSVLTPFNKNKENTQNLGANTEGSKIGYTNIWREPKLGFYALFRNQGLTPTMTLTKDNGEILVASGQFDGISKFYDKYALVTAAGKVGLIDTLGRLIIAPQDLRTYKEQLMDSLDIYNVALRKKQMIPFSDYATPLQQPITFNWRFENKWHPDSLNITTEQRHALWNLMLEKCLDNIVVTASEVSIQQAPLKATSLYFYDYSHYNAEQYAIARQVTVSDKTIAFCFANPTIMGENKEIFYNFYRRDNRWEELTINDLLQIQGDKRWLLNDFITKKIKALKDASIDCSNAESFITQAENRFMLTKEGVNFCFNSTGNYQQDFVIIAFTWAELTPFLKMKIY